MSVYDIIFILSILCFLIDAFSVQLRVKAQVVWTSLGAALFVLAFALTAGAF